MLSFVLKTCGGPNAEYLVESEMYLKTQERKSTPADVYDALSKDVPGTVEAFLCVRRAVFKFAYTRSASPGEVKRIFAKEKISQLQSIEALLREARD